MKDNGTGVSEAIISQIFDSSFTTKSVGKEREPDCQSAVT